jgi:hypothetical protein
MRCVREKLGAFSRRVKRPGADNGVARCPVSRWRRLVRSVHSDRMGCEIETEKLKVAGSLLIGAGRALQYAGRPRFSKGEVAPAMH